MICISSAGSHSRSIYTAVSIHHAPPTYKQVALGMDRLEDDIKTVLGLDKADIFDNVVVVKILEEVDLSLSHYSVSHQLQLLKIMFPTCFVAIIFPSR